MKWLFLFMVLVNIVLLIYGVQREETVPSLAMRGEPETGALRLLSENEIETSSQVGADFPVEEAGSPVQEAPVEVSQERQAAPSDQNSIEPEDTTSETDRLVGSVLLQGNAVNEEVATTALDESPEADDVASTLVEEVSTATLSPEVDKPLPVTEGVSTVTLPPEAETSPPVTIEVWTATLSPEAEQPPPVTEEVSTETLSPEAEIPLPVEEVVADVDLPADQEPQEEPVEMAVVEPRQCISLGPIKEEAVAMTLVEELTRNGMLVLPRQEVVEEPAGFWVIIPPYETTVEAREVEARLGSEGVEDYQRFYRGDYKNGISLGIFSRRFNAESRRDAIAAKGFSPEVLPRTREKTYYWFDYETTTDEKEKLIQWLKDSYPRLRLQEKACPTTGLP
ncbi:MAG: hypothetical protein GY703_21445 [Gammaproteobacteria bacterium]|nr:hypothetical protein [Gammaproteobacteria bacterium]